MLIHLTRSINIIFTLALRQRKRFFNVKISINIIITNNYYKIPTPEQLLCGRCGIGLLISLDTMLFGSDIVRFADAARFMLRSRLVGNTLCGVMANEELIDKFEEMLLTELGEDNFSNEPFDADSD